MLTRRSTFAAVAVALGHGVLGRAALAQGAPDAELVQQAKQEGRVSIYTSTDLAQGQPLVDAFKAAYPGVEPAWNDMGTTSVFNRLISEAAARQVGADVAWSSAVDLQLSAVDRGLAETFKPAEAAKLPAWANYKSAAFGTTFEATAIIWNKRLLPAELVPKTHADLTRVLKSGRDKLDGKVATYDPEKSGVGFMFASEDEAHVKDYWDMIRAFGAAHGKVYGGSGSMREKVVSGEHLMAFNVVASYAEEWAKADPNLGVGYLSDFVTAFSRPMLVPKDAPHPAAGKLFVDFTLSAAGQKALSDGGLPAVRDDVPGIQNADTLAREAGTKLTPVPLSEKSTEYLDPKKRAAFFREWRRAMQG